MEGFGRGLLFIGVAVAVLGLAIMLAPKIPLLGKLPGDLVFRRGESTFYFPLATSLAISIVVSLVLSVLLNIAYRLFR
ncbi:MAG: DUF2905 domain-containing protein [Chloroflexi bacterium]|nr:DUF2905 domain-containing protein [Chloroflexota bacterium]